MASARGHFIWHELRTSDVKGATGFYGKVAGWTTQAWDKDQSYLMFMSGKSGMGGMLREEPRRWLPYIGTDDTEVAVWEAQRLGGKVIKDTESIPSIGKFAVLQDPWGAVFAVLQPESQANPKYPVPVGDFSWHELVTKDTETAFKFYSALFGWQKTSAMDMGPDGVYQMYGWKGRQIGGIYRQPKTMPAGPRWVSYIRVRDAKAAAEIAKKSGGQILQMMEVPGGDWIAVGTDPQGVEFAVHSVTKKAKKKPAAKKRAAKKKPAKRKATKAKRRKR